ncbi:hypothetical protein M6C29_25190, partial [Escherichia coli]|nr:hypothetical protein [Escherichia coli]MCO5656785.1 hypothetical protein [Escherichia coli]
MKKLILAAAVAGAVLLSSAAQAQTTPEGYQLQQVLMMSRHNLRAPLANNGSVLEQSTPNQWSEWDVPGGQLTTKGGVLEIYMGHGTVAKLAMRQPFVLFKGLTFQKLCLPGAFRPGDHHNKMLR